MSKAEEIADKYCECLINSEERTEVIAAINEALEWAARQSEVYVGLGDNIAGIIRKGKSK